MTDDSSQALTNSCEREMNSSLCSSRRHLIALSLAMNLVFPAAVFLWGLPEPWTAFDGESSPMNWFSSVQIALLGITALIVYILSKLGRAAGSDPSQRSWPWAAIGFGFIFLSFDERFQTHERIRDEFLKPADVLTNVPGLNAADIVLPLYALVGVAVTVAVVRDLKRHASAFPIFVSALGLACFVVFQDSIALEVLQREGVRHVQIIVEEIGETWVQMLFGFALITVAFEKLEGVLTASRASYRGGPGDGEGAESRAADEPQTPVGAAVE